MGTAADTVLWLVTSSPPTGRVHLTVPAQRAGITVACLDRTTQAAVVVVEVSDIQRSLHPSVDVAVPTQQREQRVVEQLTIQEGIKVPTRYLTAVQVAVSGPSPP